MTITLESPGIITGVIVGAMKQVFSTAAKQL